MAGRKKIVDPNAAEKPRAPQKRVFNLILDRDKIINGEKNVLIACFTDARKLVDYLDGSFEPERHVRVKIEIVPAAKEGDEPAAMPVED